MPAPRPIRTAIATMITGDLLAAVRYGLIFGLINDHGFGVIIGQFFMAFGRNWLAGVKSRGSFAKACVDRVDYLIIWLQVG